MKSRKWDAMVSDLYEVYSGISTGKVELAEAKEKANILGKITRAVVSEMKYNEYVTAGNKKIAFMEETTSASESVKSKRSSSK